VTDTKDERIAHLQERAYALRDKATEQKKRAEAAERRADALERALREVQALIPDRHDPEYDRDVRSLESVLDSIRKAVNIALCTPSDQPAQDGGRLDPYTLAYVEKMVRGQQYKDGPYRQWPEFWPGNRSNDSIVTQFADRAADAIRNLHPDQPADAGEPDKSVSLRQQISEAQETVAAWPKWMTRSAKVHEPSCCARTREECARVADAYPEHEPFGADHTAHGSLREGQDSASRDIAAAIRRTGDTP
jgi:hypothetical protein